MIRAGGNTRLRMLKELYEPAPPASRKLDCLITPWRDEADTLVAHLVENGLRGSGSSSACHATTDPMGPWNRYSKNWPTTSQRYAGSRFKV